jgi:lysozyme
MEDYIQIVVEEEDGAEITHEFPSDTTDEEIRDIITPLPSNEGREDADLRFGDDRPNPSGLTQEEFDNRITPPKHGVHDVDLQSEESSIPNSGDTPRHFMEEAEGREEKVYDDVAGNPTIGVGHKITKKELKDGYILINGEKVDYKRGLTNRQIDTLYEQDVEPFSIQATAWISQGGLEHIPNIHTALTSVLFNTGINSFKGTKAHKALLRGDYPTFVKETFDSKRGFVRAGGKIVPGLVNRRQSEFALLDSKRKAPSSTTTADAVLQGSSGDDTLQDGVYTVASGDFLGKIAKNNGVTVADIMQANPDIKDANKIRVGQQINIPGAAPALAEETSILKNPEHSNLVGESADDILEPQAPGKLNEVFPKQKPAQLGENFDALGGAIDPVLPVITPPAKGFHTAAAFVPKKDLKEGKLAGKVIPHDPFDEDFLAVAGSGEAKGKDLNTDLPKMIWWGLLSKMGIDIEVTNDDLDPRTLKAFKKAVGGSNKITTYRKYGKGVLKEQRKVYEANPSIMVQAMSTMMNLMKTPDKLLQFMKDDTKTAAFVLGRVNLDDEGNAVNERWNFNPINKGLLGANSPFTAGRAFLTPFMPGPGEGPVMNIRVKDEEESS